jgi:hypothetical protein
MASEGLSVRAIARELGLSKSAVHRVLMAPDPEDPPDYEDPDDDGDEDPWDDTGPEPLGLCDTDEERWPAEPFTFVGLGSISQLSCSLPILCPSPSTQRSISPQYPPLPLSRENHCRS